MWPFKDKQPMARMTLVDAPVSATPVEPAIKTKKPPTMEQWQDLVLKYADRVPIVSAAADYYNAATQRITYDVVDVDTDEPVSDTNAKRIIEIMNAHPDDMARAVELLFLIGENRMTYNSEDGLKAWGAGELKRSGDTYSIVDENGKSTELPPDTRAWRTYRADRRWSDKASSSLKPMIDLMEAFVIAYAEERAVSIRLAMNTGVFLVNEDVFRDDSGVDESDANDTVGSDGKAKLERRFEQMLQMTIKNPRNAASFNPPVLVTPSGTPVKDLVGHVSFAAERDKRKIAERFEMLKREIAVGIDLPADVAAGFLADLNHWNARSVDNNAIKNYIGPKVGLNANNVFQELADGLGIDASSWKVILNTSDLVEREFQADNATKAWDRGLISDNAARRAYGFNEDDEAKAGDGPEFPVGSQGPAPTNDFAANNRQAFANDVGRAKLKRLSREVAESASVMREEIMAALITAAEEMGAEVILAAAGDDPVEKLTKSIQRALLNQKEHMGLSAARALSTKRAKEWYNVNFPELDARSSRAAAHAADVLKRAVKDGKFETGMARDITRSAESVGAGGPENVKDNGDVNYHRPIVSNQDKDFMALLRDEVESLTVRFAWTHGGSANPFPAHAELDGVEWTADEEREVLDNTEDFPPSKVYYPGDHAGCSCSYDASYEVV